MNKELSEENKLLIEKLKIQKKVEKEIRTYARLIMVFAAILIMFGGVGFVPPSTVEMMILVIVLSLVGVPLLTMGGMVLAIKHFTKKEFEKFLKGEGIVERE